MTFWFSVDQQQSLDIVKELLTHLKNEKDISVNQHFDISQMYLNDPPQTIEYKHQLAIIELHVDDCYHDAIDLADIQNEIAICVNDNDLDKSDKIEIHGGSYIENNKICLQAYLHETSAEGDVSYPVFSYDSLYRCWIIKDDFWGAANGVDWNGNIMILDFSAYHLKE